MTRHFLFTAFIHAHFSGRQRGRETRAGCNNLADFILITIGTYWKNNSEARKYIMWKQCGIFSVNPKYYKNVPLGFQGLNLNNEKP